MVESVQGFAKPASGEEGPDSLPSYFKVKRAIDLMVVIPLIVLALPVMLAVAVAILVSLGRPVLFWQERPGRGGALLAMCKFRTMRIAADALEPRWSDDRRQTALTRILRQLRLDELPQLVHILTGEMSLIGPRPLLPEDQPAHCDRRLQIAPGITGWAQVNGGDLLTPEEKLALDLWYVRHASLWFDLGIIWRTMLVMLFGDRRNERVIEHACDQVRAAVRSA